MATGRACPKCGIILTEDAPAGLCPVCLASLALGAAAVATEPMGGTTETIPGRPKRFGDYELLEVIGRGGSGMVFKAHHLPLKRLVALKLLKDAGLASPLTLDRFILEAETAARLEHPHIVPIYDIGDVDGQLYFAMKLMEGESLAAKLARDPGGLETSGPNPGQETGKAVAAMMVKVARAVHHAHQHGVLHRDLKPSNILFDEDQQPHLTDFGLAKLRDAPHQLTLTGAMVGTPSYIAPELAIGQKPTIAADIYGLGAVLFEVLTGRPPFVGRTPLETIRRAVDDAPPHPRALKPAVPEDLATICLRCLAKEPARRYPSALALAEDLEHFLHDEPIQARPYSVYERLIRWCRRRPAIAALLGLVGFLVIGAVVGAATAVIHITDAREAEAKERRRAQSTLREAQVSRARELFSAGESALAVGILADLQREEPTNTVFAEWLLSALTYRNHPLPSIASFNHRSRMNDAQFSSDGQFVVTASVDRTAGIWDLGKSNPIPRILKHGDQVTAVDISPDGRFVATGSRDRTARLWSAATGQPLSPSLAHSNYVTGVEFSPDGRLVVTASDDHTVRLWQVPDGQPVTHPMRHNGLVNVARFSPAGDRLATGSDDGTARLWDVTGRPIGEVMNHAGIVEWLTFSPDGHLVLTASYDHTARLWDASTGKPSSVTVQHRDWVHHAEFSPDGRSFVTASADRTAVLWDTGTGIPLKTWPHPSAVLWAVFNRKGDLVATACEDASVRLFETSSGQLYCEPLRPRADQTGRPCFSPDGRSLIAFSNESVSLWDVQPGAAIPRSFLHHRAVNSAEFSPDGKSIVTASCDNTARVWDVQSGRALTPPLNHGDWVYYAEFAPDGQRVLTISRDRTARVWDARTGQPVTPPMQHSEPSDQARFSPDGRRLVTAGRDRVVRLWDAASGEPLGNPMPHRSTVQSVEFSPDGTRILSAGSDRIAVVWDAQTSRRLSVATNLGEVIGLAHFSPDGRRFVTAGRSARVWEIASPLATATTRPLRHSDPIHAARFSPDGRWLLTASADKSARLWDTATGEPATVQPFIDTAGMLDAVFSADGRRIATASANGRVCLWETAAGLPTSVPLEHGLAVVSVRFSPDGRQVLTACRDGVVRLWDIPKVPLPIPEWLCELAEAAVGIQMNPDGSPGVTHSRGRTIIQLRGTVPSLKHEDTYGRWAEWFFADRSSRPISPWSETTTGK